MAELSRDLGAARAAYAAGNVDAMRRAHSDDKTLQNTTSNAPYREAGHGKILCDARRRQRRAMLSVAGSEWRVHLELKRAGTQ